MSVKVTNNITCAECGKPCSNGMNVDHGTNPPTYYCSYNCAAGLTPKSKYQEALGLAKHILGLPTTDMLSSPMTVSVSKAMLQAEEMLGEVQAVLDTMTWRSRELFEPWLAKRALMTEGEDDDANKH